jgi:hypothetical protein
MIPAGRGNESAVAASLCRRTPKKQKTAPPKIKKDGTVSVWLFLPSTVLTVSGSRGLWHCRFAIVDCRLNSSLQIGNWQSAIGNDSRLSAASAAPPKRYLIFKLSKGF